MFVANLVEVDQLVFSPARRQAFCKLPYTFLNLGDPNTDISTKIKTSIYLHDHYLLYTIL